MKPLLISLLLLVLLYCFACPLSKNASGKQSKLVGDGCEGCAAIYESPVPFVNLKWEDTFPGYNQCAPKMEISGTVYHGDGRPAKDVVLYLYHTDQSGIYPKRGNEQGWAQRHGYIRAWLKTNHLGQYKFYTLRPASYPKSRNPAHIHPVIKENGLNEYWIDEFEFDDDSYLDKKQREKRQQRGGHGIIKLTRTNGVWIGKRDIYLGKNIPGYQQAGNQLQSGLNIGADCPAFDPLHLSGPDKGTKACPMCKYGRGKGVMVWFNHANLERLQGFVLKMEEEMKRRGEQNFRVFLVYMNPHYQQDPGGYKALHKKIAAWCQLQKLEKVAMVWVPSPIDKETCGEYRINPEVQNTVFVYKQRKVTDKWVNIKYDEESVRDILWRF